jgi:hypothetical protein
MTSSSLFRLLPLAALIAGAAGCPGDDDPPPENPVQLWLALDGSERAVRLVPYQPEPF